MRRIIAEHPGYIQYHISPSHLTSWKDGAEYYLAAAKGGNDPFAGSVKGVRPFRSKVDGQLLLYRYTLPKDYDPAKPVEDTPEGFRFQHALKAGETKSFNVKEERDNTTTIALTNGQENHIRYFISLSEASPALKQTLETALKIKGEWDNALRELQQVSADLQRLTIDQDRIRKNLRETPKEAEVSDTYLKKLFDQEKEINALIAKQKALVADEFKARTKYEDYLSNLSE